MENLLNETKESKEPKESKIRIIKSAKIEVIPKVGEVKNEKSEIKDIKLVPKVEFETKVEDSIDKYISGFNDLEKIAYEIAKTRLKTSFDIEKSIGYIKR
jgi:hypothetical protein